MPTGIVELKHDALLLTDADRLGEVDQNGLEQWFADGIGDVPHRATGCGLDKTSQVEPLEAMVSERDRALAPGRPDAARDRFQAEAVLVRRPDLDRRTRMLALLCRGRSRELFLSAARSRGVPASGWRGRGGWIEYSMAISASQPR